MSSGGDPTQFAKQVALSRINDHPAWPFTAFRLECEVAGVYQDESGKALAELHENGNIGKLKVERNGSERSYFTNPSESVEEPEAEVQNSLKRFESFLTKCGYFGNLAAYTALCKIHDELANHIMGFSIYPEGSYPHMLNNPRREPDAVVSLPSEIVPIEVYNGGDYLGKNTRKFEQLCDLSSNPDRGLPTNPMLVNRRSDGRIKQGVRDKNGLVVDTGLILACESRRSEIQDSLNTLNLGNRIEFVPELETSDGEALDGEDYDSLSRSPDDVDKIQPPSKLVPAASDLPDQFLKRIRGGVQLQYVNSLYRRDPPPHSGPACLVLQSLYNILLREGGKTRQEALEHGWDDMRDRYPRLKSIDHRKSEILGSTGELVTDLIDDKIISRENGEIHARCAEHPQQDLSF